MIVPAQTVSGAVTQPGSPLETMPVVPVTGTDTVPASKLTCARHGGFKNSLGSTIYAVTFERMNAAVDLFSGQLAKDKRRIPEDPDHASGAQSEMVKNDINDPGNPVLMGVAPVSWKTGSCSPLDMGKQGAVQTCKDTSGFVINNCMHSLTRCGVSSGAIMC